MSCRPSVPEPPLPEPLLQLLLAGLPADPTTHLHGVVGRGGLTQIKAAAQSPPLRVRRSEDHLSHAGLHQRPGAHGAGFQGHQQGVAIETPVTAQTGGLRQGHELSVTERIGLRLTAVAAPADGPPPGIEHHGRHGHLSLLTRCGGAPQQPLHPQHQVAFGEGGQ